MKLISGFLLALLIGVFSWQAMAARVDILPRKIVLEDRERSADVTLMNITDEASIVRVELISYAQNSSGDYTKLASPLNPAFDPDKLVRISPKQFTLPPRGRQKIRLSVQRPEGLPDGEYRFHVKTVSYDPEDFSVRLPQGKGSNVSINMNVGVVIPVIVRKGQLTTGAKLENISFVPASQSESKQPSLKLDITRTGTAGTLGTILVYSDGGGKLHEIGRVGNVNVFSEIKTRSITVPLNEVPTGNVRLQYINDFGDKGVLDEVVLQK